MILQRERSIDFINNHFLNMSLFSYIKHPFTNIFFLVVGFFLGASWEMEPIEVENSSDLISLSKEIKGPDPEEIKIDLPEKSTETNYYKIGGIVILSFSLLAGGLFLYNYFQGADLNLYRYLEVLFCTNTQTILQHQASQNVQLIEHIDKFNTEHSLVLNQNLITHIQRADQSYKEIISLLNKNEMVYNEHLKKCFMSILESIKERPDCTTNFKSNVLDAFSFSSSSSE